MTLLRPTLNDLLATPEAAASSVRGLLSTLTAEARVKQATALDRAALAALWQLAEDGPAVSLADLVAPDLEALHPIVYEGLNSLPVMRRFRKVLYRTSSGTIAGYNDSPARWFAGPGYFTVVEVGTSVDIDYRLLPTERPAAFPAIRSNDRGPAKLVYGDMVDNLRTVADGVYVGRAVRHGVETANYFVIAR